jgi:hypothetical protein
MIRDDGFRDEFSRSTKANTRNKMKNVVIETKSQSRSHGKNINDSDSISDFTTAGGFKKYNKKIFMLFSVALVVAIGGPLIYKHWPKPVNVTNETSAPKAFNPTAFPTTSPLIYDPPSRNNCLAISLGKDVQRQESMISKSFDIMMDVTLTVQTTDMQPVIEELAQKMQEILAPSLADCPQITSVSTANMRGNKGRRMLQNKYAIANAIIELDFRENKSCTPGSSEICSRVIGTINLFLKGPEPNMQLINRISVLFGSSTLVQQLKLASPFKNIKVVGVVATDPERPTFPPSPGPTRYPTVHPTISPPTTISPTFTRRSDIEVAMTHLSALFGGSILDLNEDALDWLLNTDDWVPLGWLPSLNGNNEIWIDRYILAFFFLDTEGNKKWTNDFGWMTSWSVCSWYGVSCDESSVVGLELASNNLKGSIPTELSFISNLKTLSLCKFSSIFEWFLIMFALSHNIGL